MTEKKVRTERKKFVRAEMTVFWNKVWEGVNLFFGRGIGWWQLWLLSGQGTGLLPDKA